MNQTSLTLKDLKQLAAQIRYWILKSTSKASSGHPSSSLSSVELMTSLLFGGFFRFKLNDPHHKQNDRLIFSKGHAAPLLYALFAISGAFPKNKLLNLREFASPLEGHPSKKFEFTEAATGSLGQGLSIGAGMAINAKYLDGFDYRTFVLLGDSEMSEGQIWEAIQISSFYKLNNLIGIIDVNRLGQTGETMYGHDLEAYSNKVSSFGWNTILIDGHSFSQILEAYKAALKQNSGPTMIIAKTLKGKGVKIMEDKNGWHGKTLSPTHLDKAISDLGSFDPNMTANLNSSLRKKKIDRPSRAYPEKEGALKALPKYQKSKSYATRAAFGSGLAKEAKYNPKIISLDAEVKNATYSNIFENHFPKRFFEMFIAEQNMVSLALGLSLRGKIPFVSTFAAFLTRAFDQIRMAQYSNANIKFVGSHVGVSIGQDGPSQMGLEDISMFRSINSTKIFYPSDAVSCERLVRIMAKDYGLSYLRTTRKETPVIYSPSDEFRVGGSKILAASDEDQIAIISAGVTLHEALAAHKELSEEDIKSRVIDLYCLKPLDTNTILEAADETGLLLTIEDHHPEGGIGEAVKAEVGNRAIVHSLSVAREEMSGEPEKLLDYEDISAKDIFWKAKDLIEEKNN